MGLYFSWKHFHEIFRENDFTKYVLDFMIPGIIRKIGSNISWTMIFYIFCYIFGKKKMKTYPKPKTRSVITNAIALSVVSNVCFMQNDPDYYLAAYTKRNFYLLCNSCKFMKLKDRLLRYWDYTVAERVKYLNNEDIKISIYIFAFWV